MKPCPRCGCESERAHVLDWPTMVCTVCRNVWSPAVKVNEPRDAAPVQCANCRLHAHERWLVRSKGEVCARCVELLTGVPA